jgi:hypothetical protein
MSRNDIPCFPYHSRRASGASTDKEFIVVDISDLVREFCNDVDRQVESLSYDIEGIIRQYSAYRHVGRYDEIVTGLSNKFLELGCVKVEDDAPIIARAALTLYRAITDHIRDLEYLVGAIHDVKLKLNSINRQIRCNAIMMVI